MTDNLFFVNSKIKTIHFRGISKEETSKLDLKGIPISFGQIIPFDFELFIENFKKAQSLEKI